MNANLLPSGPSAFSGVRQCDRRANRRYPITLELQYKLLNKGQVEHMGIGWTLDISSGGVLLEADTTLPTTGSIELAIHWPFRLEGVCKLNLVMRGQIVRCDTDPRVIAVRAKYHELHTAGARSPRALTMTAASRSIPRGLMADDHDRRFTVFG